MHPFEMVAETLDQWHPLQTLINLDLRRTCVRPVCPIPGRRCTYGPESRATHFARPAHMARSDFTRARPTDGNPQISQQDCAGLIPRSTVLSERKAAGTRD